MKINKDIRIYLDNGNLALLFNSNNTHLHCVNFEPIPPTVDPYQASYVINLSTSFPETKCRPELVCIFPNLPNVKRQLIHSSGYSDVAKMNIDINSAFRDSLELTETGRHTKFAVAYGNHIYRCKDLVGTIYILWATNINKQNASNVANILHNNCPLIFNLDGQNVVKGIFILKANLEDTYTELPLLPMAKGSLTILCPRAPPVYVCETRPPAPKKRDIATITKLTALSLATAPAKTGKTWLPFEQNPFSNENNGVEQVVPVDNWSASPRPADAELCFIPSDFKETWPRDPFDSDNDFIV